MSSTGRLQWGNKSFFDLVKQRLDMGDDVLIPVKGKSMQPFLYEGDEVLLRRIMPADLRIGAIVLVEWRSTFVLHRLVRKDKGMLYLAGDNNLVQLEDVAETAMLGLLVEARREGKPLPITSAWSYFLGLTWYHLRFPRRVWAGLTRRLGGKRGA